LKEEVVKAKVFCINHGVHVERKDTSSSKIPKWCYSYNINFELMVIKHAEKRSNYCVAQKFCATGQSAQDWRKQN
jgi:hypothetical protein